MKTTLMAAASALMLTAGVASAAPAVTASAVNVHSGPGARFPVVATLPPGASVDANCNGAWCAIDSGYVNAGALQFAAAPDYYNSPDVYADSDYYDNGPDVYGPGFYGPGGFRQHRHVGDNRWQRGPGRTPAAVQNVQPQRSFAGPTRNNFAAPARNFGTNQGAPRMSAPVGMHTGGPSMGARGPSIGARGPSVGAHRR